MERDIRVELVQYQSPLLRMKIWEIAHLAAGPVHSTAPVKQWHYHPEAEIVLFLEGSNQYFIDRTSFTLSPGEVMLVGPSQLHAGRNRTEGKIRYIVCQFDLRQYLDSFAAPYFYFFANPESPLSRLNEQIRADRSLNDSLAAAVTSIYEESQQRRVGYELAVSMHMKHIMVSLLRACLGNGEEARYRAIESLRPLLDYIEVHVSDKMDLKAASGVLNMNYHYVSRLFRKAMGVTFVDYVNGKRIQAAQRLLATSDIAVSEVGAEVGIGNAAHFFELFRRHNGCTPAEFRRRLRA